MCILPRIHFLKEQTQFQLAINNAVKDDNDDTESLRLDNVAPVRPRTPSETLAEHLGVSQSEARARLNNIPRLREEFFKARSLNQRDQARDIKKQIRELEEPLFVVGQVCARASSDRGAMGRELVGLLV